MTEFCLSSSQRKMLQDIISRNDSEAFESFVKSLPFVDFDLGGGTNVLHWCAEVDRPELILIASKMGATIDKEANGGATPLDYATYGKNEASVKCLVSLGANPTHGYEHSGSSIDIARSLKLPHILDVLTKHEPIDRSR